MTLEKEHTSTKTHKKNEHNEDESMLHDIREQKARPLTSSNTSTPSNESPPSHSTN
jgi:hypothetical protein